MGQNGHGLRAAPNPRPRSRPEAAEEDVACPKSDACTFPGLEEAPDLEQSLKWVDILFDLFNYSSKGFARSEGDKDIGTPILKLIKKKKKN